MLMNLLLSVQTVCGKDLVDVGTSKNVWAQNALFVINSWKVKELILAAMHIMRDALFVPFVHVGEASFFVIFTVAEMFASSWPANI